jgi:hypothetical protein
MLGSLWHAVLGHTGPRAVPRCPGLGEACAFREWNGPVKGGYGVSKMRKRGGARVLETGRGAEIEGQNPGVFGCASETGQHQPTAGEGVALVLVWLFWSSLPMTPAALGSVAAGNASCGKRRATRLG